MAGCHTPGELWYGRGAARAKKLGSNSPDATRARAANHTTTAPREDRQMGTTDDLGIINEYEYDDQEYTESSQDMAEQGSELIDRLWVAGASITNLCEELTNALHNSVVSNALNLVVKIERKS